MAGDLQLVPAWYEYPFRLGDERAGGDEVGE